MGVRTQHTQHSSQLNALTQTAHHNRHFALLRASPIVWHFFLCHLLEFANFEKQMGRRKTRHLQEFCKADLPFTKMWTQPTKVFSTHAVSVAHSGSPPPLVLRRSTASCFIPWLGSCSLEASPRSVAGRSAWRSASSASFPGDCQVVHDRRWPMAAEPQLLIHLAATVISVFRSCVGVAVARGSHGRSVFFAKSRMDLHKCQASPGICQVSKNAKPICKTVGEVFCEFWQKLRMQKQYAKLLEIL